MALRVFAATYNGGNKEYSHAGDTEPLFDAMLNGHEGADIILVGLQEFKDPDDRMYHMVRKRLLWHDLAREKTKEAAAAIEAAMQPSSAATSAQAQLLEDLKKWRNGISAALTPFLQAYGGESTEFHTRVASQSPILKLEEQAMMIDGSKDEFLRQRAQYEALKQLAMKERLKGMKDSAKVFHRAVNLDKVREILDKSITPIETWATDVSNTIRTVRNRFPSVGEQADHAWYEVLSDAFKLENLREFLADAHEHAIEKVRMQLAEYQKGIEMAIDSAETSLVSKMLSLFEAQADDHKSPKEEAKYWNASLFVPMNQTVARDVAAVLRSGAERSVRAVVRQEAAIQQTHLLSAVNKLQKAVKELKVVFRVPALAVDPAQVEVSGGLQRFWSGNRCHLWPVKHFDLISYLYVNPWSDWKVKQVEFSSYACKNWEPSKGCNIDQADGYKECGKGVNLMVFDVTHAAGQRIRLCTLNTHLSYAGNTMQRQNNIIKALEETERARCTATIYVGDFNSRLHCDSQEGAMREKLPPYERVHPRTGTKPDLMWETHCQGSTECSLRDSPHNIQDELTQLLSASMIRCYEEQKKNLLGGGGGFHMVTSWNIMKKWGLQEAFNGPPSFPPTYTVKPEKDAMKKKGNGKAWVKCIEGTEWCYLNKDADGKHNPAWTDRVLYRATLSSNVVTTSYERRLVPASVGSDHIPAVAEFQITPLDE